MPGDIEAAMENAITRIFKSGLQSDILKVSHHGSKYSSSAKFLARVKAKYGFISAGVNNNHGHPHQETIDRLVAAGVALYSTQNGTQSITIPAERKGEVLVLNNSESQTAMDIVFDGIFDEETIGVDSEVLEEMENDF